MILSQHLGSARKVLQCVPVLEAATLERDQASPSQWTEWEDLVSRESKGMKREAVSDICV